MFVPSHASNCPKNTVLSPNQFTKYIQHKQLFLPTTHFHQFWLRQPLVHLPFKHSVNECVTSGQVLITNNYDLQ